MTKRARILVVSAMLLPLFLAPPTAPDQEKVPEPIDRLLHEFVKAFNSGDYETMASFYKSTATTSFNERRTGLEDRKLYQKLQDMFGKLT